MSPLVYSSVSGLCKSLHTCERQNISRARGVSMSKVSDNRVTILPILFHISYHLAWLCLLIYVQAFFPQFHSFDDVCCDILSAFTMQNLITWQNVFLDELYAFHSLVHFIGSYSTLACGRFHTGSCKDCFAFFFTWSIFVCGCQDSPFLAISDFICKDTFFSRNFQENAWKSYCYGLFP